MEYFAKTNALRNSFSSIVLRLEKLKLQDVDDVDADDDYDDDHYDDSDYDNDQYDNSEYSDDYYDDTHYDDRNYGDYDYEAVDALVITSWSVAIYVFERVMVLISFTNNTSGTNHAQRFANLVTFVDGNAPKIAASAMWKLLRGNYKLWSCRLNTLQLATRRRPMLPTLWKYIRRL